jgi:FkbM family methyltransferase
VTARRMKTEMRLNLADNVQRTLYLTGTYEPSLLRWLRRELRRGDICVDVGGHIGIHSLVAGQRLRELGEGSVYVFEPAPDSAAALRKVTSDLPVSVVEAALGSVAGRMELRADPSFHNTDASTRSRFNEGEVICESPLLPFDTWADQAGVNRIDVVKIDVEGSEHDVLVGMTASIRGCRPRTIAVELQPRRLEQAGHTAEEVTALLAESGYAVAERLPGDNVVFRLARALA